MIKSMEEFKVLLPPRKSYKTDNDFPSIDSLPFVHRPVKGISKRNTRWNIDKNIEDYGDACQIGMEYAAHMTQYLKDNPSIVGSNVIGHIVADIDFNDESTAKGYWIGFFSYLERIIHAQATKMDVFDDIDRVHERYFEFIKQMDKQEQEREFENV